MWLVRQIRGEWLSEPSMDVKDFAAETGLSHQDVGSQETVQALFEAIASKANLLRTHNLEDE